MRKSLSHVGHGGSVLTLQYRERAYRQQHRQNDLIHFQVVVKETDLDIGIRKERFSKELAKRAEQATKQCRIPLEEYIKRDPAFVKAITPYEVLPDAPPIVVEMASAARRAGVGPMAAVAGAVAECVGRSLARYSRDVIVENGGDIYLRTSRIRHIGIFAGKSPLNQRMALEIRPKQSPIGICTSSGTVGHSLSFGIADAVVVLSPSVALADAVATASANLVQKKEDLATAVDFALKIEGVLGAIAILDEMLAVRGHVKLVPIVL